MYRCCSEDPDVKGTETWENFTGQKAVKLGCSEDPDVKGTETLAQFLLAGDDFVAARIPM